MGTIARYFTPSFLRRRRGDPIVIVSGLPRSGTSMAMAMLAAGGLPVLTDDVRGADASNPLGYYELERVTRLDRDLDRSWLADARGKGIKIVSFLLASLPDTYDYKVIFMRRPLDDIIASQEKMLDDRGAPRGADAARTRAIYEDHLQRVFRLLESGNCFSTAPVEYTAVVADPVREATRIAQFVGRHLDTSKMAQIVDPALNHGRPSE